MLEIIGYIVKLIGAIVKVGVDAARIKAEEKAADEVSEKNLEKAKIEAEYKREVAHEATRTALLKAVGTKMQVNKPVEADNTGVYLLLFLLLLGSGFIVYTKRSNGSED